MSQNADAEYRDAEQEKQPDHGHAETSAQTEECAVRVEACCLFLAEHFVLPVFAVSGFRFQQQGFRLDADPCSFFLAESVYEDALHSGEQDAIFAEVLAGKQFLFAESQIDLIAAERLMADGPRQEAVLFQQTVEGTERTAAGIYRTRSQYEVSVCRHLCSKVAQPLSGCRLEVRSQKHDPGITGCFGSQYQGQGVYAHLAGIFGNEGVLQVFISFFHIFQK